MKRKNILVVYPHNFFVEKSGINTRYIQLMNYFKARNFNVDMLTLKNFKSSWTHYPTDKWGLIAELFFYDFKKGARWQWPKNKKRSLWNRIRKKIPLFHRYSALPDFAYKSLKKQWSEILARTHYDFILISYVYWANLLEVPAVKKSTTVLDLTDFSTLNAFDHSGGNIKIGNMMAEEIRRVNLFDKVMCISTEEKSFFSQFTGKPRFYFIPFFMKKNPNHAPDMENTRPAYDMIFVGSDNPHNRKGIEWLFNDVLPLLEKSFKILIVGTISRYVPRVGNHQGHVTCLENVENLTDLYRQSKIALCPLLGGTGLKIKVVEALAFGKPVVSTSKGMVGLPAKTGSGILEGDSAEEFAGLISQLMSDNVLYQKTAAAAERFFLEHFEEAAVYTVLDKVFIR